MKTDFFINLGDENAIREVISHGSDINEADEGGSVALHFATNNGKLGGPK